MIAFGETVNSLKWLFVMTEAAFISILVIVNWFINSLYQLPAKKTKKTGNWFFVSLGVGLALGCWGYYFIFLNLVV